MISSGPGLFMFYTIIALYILESYSLAKEATETNSCVVPTKIIFIIDAISHVLMIIYGLLLQFLSLQRQAKNRLDNLFDLLFGPFPLFFVIFRVLFHIISQFTIPHCPTPSFYLWMLTSFILAIHYRISRLFYPRLKLSWQIFKEKRQRRNQLDVNGVNGPVLELQDLNNPPIDPVRRDNQPSIFDVLIEGNYLEACETCPGNFNYRDRVTILPKIEQLILRDAWRKSWFCPGCMVVRNAARHAAANRRIDENQYYRAL